MITTHKERLPDHLSYPVGLQILAAALADAPQTDNLSIWFCVCNGSVMKTEKKRKYGAYYPILSARFHHYRVGISECRSMPSLYEPTWSLTVYGVTRKKRSVARRLLIEQGITIIADWLKAPRSETWRAGKKEITVSFSDNQENIIVREASVQ